MTSKCLLATSSALLAAVVLVQSAAACSAVLLAAEDSPVVARNYDWHLGHALVMVNQPGIAKQALSFDRPATWTSRHGSVTVNQYGRELPCEGINEQGLAIAVLWLDESEYPAADDRPSLTTAQWLQYQLDTAATVADVVASDHRVRITPLGGAKVHYFVADASGDCAVIEFLQGRQVVHRGDDLPHRLITNHSHAESDAFLRQHQRTGAPLPPLHDAGSLSRYVRLAHLAAQPLDATQPRHLAALEVVDGVAHPSRTRWQTAFDLRERRLYFRTRERREVREVSLADIAFGADRPVQVLDINAAVSGDVVKRFRDYQPADHRRLVERSFARSSFIQGLPAALVEWVIVYPEVGCRTSAEAIRR